MRVYRKLLPPELPRFENHLLRLDGEDRRSRFTGSVSEERIVAYCRRKDWFHGLIIGCFIDGELRATAELVWDEAPLPRRVELAVTVEGPWQDQGIGTELLRRSVVLARTRSIETIYMICLLDNRRMQTIARKFDGSIHVIADMAEADIGLPFPTQFSLWQEALADGAGVVAECLMQISVNRARSGEEAMVDRDRT